MPREILEHHDRAPAAPAFMARALLPSAGLPKDGGFPRIVQRWTGLRIEPAQLAAFREATGDGNADRVSILYPHVLGFRLQMALLTHRAFPFPIWRALQIRNRLARQHDFGPGESLELETRTGGYRIVDKGIEVDLVSRLSRGSDCVWASEITYFYRGRFGAGESRASGVAPPDLSRASVIERFKMPSAGGWRFGNLTGDYNGIHNWPWYARRLGFRTAFLHPQRVAGICMAKLRGPDAEAQTLDLWIKGPVFYGANVALRADGCGDEAQFGLSVEQDQRMAVLASWRNTGSN